MATALEKYLAQGPYLSNKDLMLRPHFYSMAELTKSIWELSLQTLLDTQTLTADFCVRFILDEDYAAGNEETYICDGDVLDCQPHLSKDDLDQARLAINEVIRKKNNKKSTM